MARRRKTRLDGAPDIPLTVDPYVMEGGRLKGGTKARNAEADPLAAKRVEGAKGKGTDRQGKGKVIVVPDQYLEGIIREAVGDLLERGVLVETPRGYDLSEKEKRKARRRRKGGESGEEGKTGGEDGGEEEAADGGRGSGEDQ